MREIVFGAIWASGVFVAAVLFFLVLIEVCVVWDLYLAERRRRKERERNTIELIRRGR